MGSHSFSRKLIKLIQPTRLVRGSRARAHLLSRLDGFSIGSNAAIASGCIFADGVRRQIVELGDCVDVREDCIFYIGEVHVGDDTFIGRGCLFHAGIFHTDTDSGSVSIGARCDIAPKVTFLCGTHEIGGANRRAGAAITKDIVVGDGVWIGSNATILPGVRIGSGAVIGAGSVVTKDIPANVVAVGNPARVLKELPE